ncbi:ACT domain-containing protein [Jannaschia sp. W003]|uniref:ACT domain-containing protein n=1 Tax=Jannaschia sp. W003 TaxID=2867012 RepID=UPI0021A91275|nr:ACT domain-containing protein [Jannaschia sp. W003]
MRPVLDPQPYVFATVRGPVPDVRSIMRFEEAEGTTLVLAPEAARAAGLETAFPCRRITLNVHSALDAVGFLAAVTARLAAEGMGVNPVAGFFHDYLFVPEDRAADAMAALRAMAEEAAVR